MAEEHSQVMCYFPKYYGNLPPNKHTLLQQTKFGDMQNLWLQRRDGLIQCFIVMWYVCGDCMLWYCILDFQSQQYAHLRKGWGGVENKGKKRSEYVNPYIPTQIKSLRKIEVTICNHQPDSQIYAWPVVGSYDLQVWSYMTLNVLTARPY